MPEVMSLHGNAKGKRENSSTTTSKYLFGEAEGIGPLKSMASRSKGGHTLIDRRYPGATLMPPDATFTPP